MKRLFIAIPIVPDTGLISLIHNLGHNLSYEPIIWSKAHNLHLTLKFLGETTESKIDDIIQLMKEVACQCSEFEIILNKVGVFGSRYQPRIIWLGSAELSQDFVDLVNRIVTQLDQIGFLRDNQNIVPHLTLGRIRFLYQRKVFQQQIDMIHNQPYQLVRVTHYNLYESTLTSSGPVYHIIEKFDLSKLQ